jgi:plastocyanin
VLQAEGIAASWRVIFGFCKTYTDINQGRVLQYPFKSHDLKGGDNMNSKVIIGVVVLILIVGGAWFVLGKNNSSQTQQPSTTTQTQNQASPTTAQTTVGKNAVTIQSFAFSPATITVKVGDSVTWTNQDSVGHSATADDNSFDTGVFSQGQSKSITFSKAGTFTYHCSVHPNMKAKVVVQ